MFYFQFNNLDWANLASFWTGCEADLDVIFVIPLIGRVDLMIWLVRWGFLFLSHCSLGVLPEAVHPVEEEKGDYCIADRNFTWDKNQAFYL